MINTHASIFSLLRWTFTVYTVSWVTTFVSSLINAIWMTYVFRFDFLSSIDGALANQIGIVLLNELYLLVSVILGWKVFFSKGVVFNLFMVLLSAVFISLLLYAPMIAFNLFAAHLGVEISGNSPLYDRFNGLSETLVDFTGRVLNAHPEDFRNKAQAIFDGSLGLISALGIAIAIALQMMFSGRKKR